MSKNFVSRWNRLWMLLLLISSMALQSSAALGQAEEPRIYFAEGKAFLDVQNRDSSRQAAVLDLQHQALIHAIGDYVGAAQIGVRYASISETLLSKPEKYVEAFQVDSESTGDSLLRVRGLVTVAAGALSSDLAEEGLAKKETKTGLNGANPAPEPRSRGASACDDNAAGSGQLSRGVFIAKHELLWIVAEKWESQWTLPADRTETRSLFAGSALQELQDFNWAIRLPDTTRLSVDEFGNVSSNQALEMAREKSLQFIALGNIAFRQSQDKGSRLELALRLLRADGKSMGDIRRELAIGDSSNQEAALELASTVAPLIDELLCAPGETGGSPRGVQRQETPSEVTLKVVSGGDYSLWTGFEKLLRERFKSAQVKAIELGSKENTVRVTGVGVSDLRSLDGAALPGGFSVRVQELGGDNPSVSVEFVKAGNQSDRTQ